MDWPQVLTGAFHVFFDFQKLPIPTLPFFSVHVLTAGVCTELWAHAQPASDDTRLRLYFRGQSHGDRAGGRQSNCPRVHGANHIPGRTGHSRSPHWADTGDTRMGWFVGAGRTLSARRAPVAFPLSS